MSTIYLHVGQAGNQLGEHIWQRQSDYYQPIHKQYHDIIPTLYAPGFNPDARVRALLIDTEPKVVTSVHHRTHQYRYKLNSTTGETTVNSQSVFRNSNIIYEQSGRGNNWALGYADQPDNDRSILHRTMESLRCEMERSDITVDAICIVTSTSGGTGSGLGSRIVETIRETYPELTIMSCCVLPYTTGETPLQHYNSLFTLAHHYTYTDGLLLFNNNDVHAAIQHATARYSTPSSSTSTSANGLHSMTFDIMNRYIADCILDILSPVQHAMPNVDTTKQPIYNSRTHSIKPLPVLPCRITDLVQHMCPLSSIKLLEAYTTSGLTELANEVAANNTSRPKTAAQRKLASFSAQSNIVDTLNWNGLTDQLLSVIPKHSQPNSTFAYNVYARGNADNSWSNDTQSRIDVRMNKQLPCVDWNPVPSAYTTTSIPPLSHFAGAQQRSSKSLSVCINRSYNADRMAALLARGKLMYDNRAFTHWYERYGIGENQFTEAFETVQTIVDNYKEMNVT